MCHISSNKIKGKKVRDHDHMTGKYRGAAYNECILNLNLPKFVPIFFHNLKYDSKLFLRWILKLRNIHMKGKKKDKKDLNIIPSTSENYITFSVKVDVDKYEQKYDLSKCKKCKKHYYQIVQQCCHSKTTIKSKGEIYDILLEIKFIDTYRFMNQSLDKLVKNLLDINNCYC